MSTYRRIPALALAAAVLLAASACSDETDSPDSDSGTSPSPSAPSESGDESPTATATATATPTPTATSTAEPTPTAEPMPEAEPEPELIAYAGGESSGVEIQKPADVQQLRGAPASFKRFMRVVITELREQTTCDDGFVGVVVEFLRTDGFASGGVNDCGGYAALWAVDDGEWKEILGTQEAFDCATLEEYAVPSDIAGERCFDDATGDVRDYEQA